MLKNHVLQHTLTLSMTAVWAFLLLRKKKEKKEEKNISLKCNNNIADDSQYDNVRMNVVVVAV